MQAQQQSCTATGKCPILRYDTENEFFERIEVFEDLPDTKISEFIGQAIEVETWPK